MNSMDKSGLKVSLLLAFAFIFAIGSVVFANSTQEVIREKTDQQFIYTPEFILDSWDTINDIKIIEDVAVLNAQSHDYKLHVYDCTQFSKELVRQLKELGYKAQCTAGNNWNFDYTNHTWVSVWIDNIRYEIEATSGKILNKDDYSTYEVKWENKCW